MSKAKSLFGIAGSQISLQTAESTYTGDDETMREQQVEANHWSGGHRDI